MIKFKVKIMLAVRDMTQKELAEKTGIRPPTISAICLGTIKQLPIEGLNKICKALDCQPSDLMEYIEDSAEDTPESAEQLFSTFQEEMKGECGSSRLKGTAGQQAAINRGAPFSGIATFTTIFAICSG